MITTSDRRADGGTGVAFPAKAVGRTILETRCKTIILDQKKGWKLIGLLKLGLSELLGTVQMDRLEKGFGYRIA